MSSAALRLKSGWLPAWMFHRPERCRCKQSSPFRAAGQSVRLANLVLRRRCRCLCQAAEFPACQGTTELPESARQPERPWNSEPDSSHKQPLRCNGNERWVDSIESTSGRLQVECGTSDVCCASARAAEHVSSWPGCRRKLSAGQHLCCLSWPCHGRIRLAGRTALL